MVINRTCSKWLDIRPNNFPKSGCYPVKNQLPALLPILLATKILVFFGQIFPNQVVELLVQARHRLETMLTAEFLPKLN
jgi:hypothetical protein